MTDERTAAAADRSSMRKDPDEWTTGDEPMSGAQRSYLETLSEEADEPFDEYLTRAEAAKRIDELRRRTGRTEPWDEDLGPAARENGTEAAEGC